MRLLFVLATAALLLAGCDSGPANGDGGGTAGGPLRLPSGDITALTIVDLRTGTGAEVEQGDTAVVHYTGWLHDPNAENRRGRQFDSSRGGETYSFRLGITPVINGWHEGVAGMRVGGRRYLFIPPELGYGEAGYRDVIPPNATLVFDIELLEIETE